MSCTKRFIELGEMIEEKQIKPDQMTDEEWYSYAYKYVTGKELPENWENDQNFLETYLPVNVYDNYADQTIYELQIPRS